MRLKEDSEHACPLISANAIRPANSQHGLPQMQDMEAAESMDGEPEHQ